MKSKVTIGVCVRNGERQIANALESIVSQDYPHELIEIILVDDGSQDHTLSIMRNYVKKMDIPSRIFSQEWRGLSVSRNIVVKNAKGEYIVWVDCDEVLAKDHIKKHVEYMDNNPKVGISIGFVLVPRGYWLVELDLLPALVERTRFLRLGSPLKHPVTGGAAFRLEALRHVKGFDEKISGAGEDVEIGHRIMERGWLLGATDARFWERKGDIKTLGQLWKKYVWYGYGGHKIYLRNKGTINYIRMTPLAGILAGILYSVDAYKLTKRKNPFLMLLLPTSFALKYTAWCLGFTKSHIETLTKKKSH
jgi:glycosyltransferase involved in cell wall biosynthesis